MTKEAYSHGYDREVVDYLAARKASKEAEFLLPHLEPGMRLLDCGCGPGTTTCDLAALVAPGAVVGIDIEASQVERARSVAAARGIDNVRFEVADLRALPLADGSFDVAHAHTVPQHLPDPARGLAEMRRVLRPGGVIALREEDWGGNIVYPASDLVRRSIEVMLDDWSACGGDPFLPRRYRALLREAGFTDIQVSAVAVVRSGEDAASWTKLVAHYLSQQIRQRVLDRGAIDSAALDAMAGALGECGADPDALWIQVFGQVIARRGG